MIKKVHHLVFLLSIQFTPESNKSHYILPFHGRPSLPPLLQSEHSFENYFNFRENENKNLQHLIVSKHRTTRAEGKYRKGPGKWVRPVTCSSGKFYLYTAAQMDRMADLHIGRCEGKKKKKDFQKFLKFWQIPPKCKDWR